MSSPIISVENLSKCYLVSHQSSSHGRATFREILQLEINNFARKAVNLLRAQQLTEGDQIEQLWALKDVSFEVRAGEIVGIIGRNGAGKSTLLKILSRITVPTRGTVRLRGRIASLLEVGTGFHPELTGRENIFLNGAILGMSRADIKRKFDEIVAFAGTERFLDLPIKKYSSGMYVRLAFAVAAHIEPDILIVDEVLAVGDYEFQQKCLGKMHDVASREGRTVLLVSHNLSAINDMANRALLLESGRVIIDGPVLDAISRYLSKDAAGSTYVSPHSGSYSTPHIRKINVVTSDPNGIHKFGAPLEIKFWIRHPQPMSKACFSFNIVNYSQRSVVHAWALHPQYVFGQESDESVLTCRFPSVRLNVGPFYLRTHLTEPPGREIYEELDGICPFEIVRNDPRLWGWHPEDCAYHERWSWIVEATK
jgi:lipopolysaccharide transport system ATP-binding protein